MTKDRVGWRFPPTHGGLAGGFNDPGIAHFSGSPLSSLARETIQNSLDARKDLGKPVHVSFELIDVQAKDMGREELAQAIASCQREPTDDVVTRGALELAKETVELDGVPCLRISDRNTTGLQGEHWKALVKKQGVSHKPGVEGAGGSFGIGKYAPFAVSALRTVFYWTAFDEGGSRVEKFQGKAVLMSHESDEGETQGTGFFGFKERCSELKGSEVPRVFRVLDRNDQAVEGTSLAILGFRRTHDWRRRVAASVVQNFFYAISTGKLTVIVEPEGEDQLIEMDDSSLPRWFDYLKGVPELGVDADITVDEAELLWDITTKEEPAAEKQDVDLGHCRLWIRVGEGLPSKVAFVRRTGMLVTTEQRGLVRFPALQDFVALCVFEDPEGNELLRQMENPTHSQFEPDRLPDHEQARGRRALSRITRWIRSELRKYAGPPEGGRRTVLSELAAYLPDLHPEDAFDGQASEGGEEAEKEPGFGERLTLTLKPIRRPTPLSLPVEDETADGSGDGQGEDTGDAGGGAEGENGGEGGDGGVGEGDGTGGTGSRGGGSRRRGVGISRVRVLPVPEKENCVALSFVADSDGVARLELEEAGDSSAVARGDVRATDPSISLDALSLTRGEAVVLEITGDGPMTDRAWRVSAIETGREQV